MSTHDTLRALAEAAKVSWVPVNPAEGDWYERERFNRFDPVDADLMAATTPDVVLGLLDALNGERNMLAIESRTRSALAAEAAVLKERLADAILADAAPLCPVCQCAAGTERVETDVEGPAFLCYPCHDGGAK